MIDFSALPGTQTLLAFLAVLLVVVVVLLVILLRRQRDPTTSNALQSLIDRLTELKATQAQSDQRLGQLQTQISQDTTLLREQTNDRLDAFRSQVTENLNETRAGIVASLTTVREQLNTSLAEHRTRNEEQATRALKSTQESMQKGFDSLHQQLGESLLRNSTELGQRLDTLTRRTDERLKEIGGQVDKRLSEGFEKTTETFGNVIKRLALIDEAQKKITALSTEVVSLQQLLADKRSRGAFGEVQLATLVANVMPPAGYALQYRLGNDRIADCILFLPPPNGNICIDAKFPLESFRVMTDLEKPASDRRQAETQFKQDIKKHIRDIADRYIVRGETSDGAIMFIPAEAVFAEIQAHHPDLTDLAHASRVWLASPTTLWAILNTASAVLKDFATREQVDLIQQHLGYLSKDFARFQERMDKLATHITQAHKDVNDVNISARKISDRFGKIERVELDAEEANPASLPGID